jgi:hypothetical protein
MKIISIVLTLILLLCVLDNGGLVTKESNTAFNIPEAEPIVIHKHLTNLWFCFCFTYAVTLIPF